MDSLSSSTQRLLTPSDMVSYLSSAPGPSILIDNTSSTEIANTYPAFLRQGVSIVTPNKLAFSGSQSLFDEIFTTARSLSDTNPSHGLIYHEATVGAGLPIISTLKDLLETGDRVLQIEGVLSGTLSFLFNVFNPASSLSSGAGSSTTSPASSESRWSVEVLKAKNLGYTEPDPRDDLNGLDVARKVVILARLAGLKIESPYNFHVQSLIPVELKDEKSAREFLIRLSNFDRVMEDLRAEAREEGKLVRYVGSLDVESGRLEVGTRKVETDSPVGGLRGSDNLVSIWTERYGGREGRPLVIQGPG